MIEFTAECGHTVRARDDDAGRMVRCTYCGRDAQVPQGHDDDLDALLREAQEDAGTVVEVKAKRRGRHRKGGPRFGLSDRSRREFNPFALIVRMIWVSLLLVIVVVVTQKVVLPFFKEPVKPTTVPQPRADQSGGAPADGRARRASGDGMGLGNLRGNAGLIVTSVPEGAEVWWMPLSQAPRTGRLNAASECRRAATGEAIAQAGPGTYVVEVAVPWNEKSLISYPGYTEFRRRIDGSSAEAAAQAAAEYFLPDGATDVLVDKTNWGQIYLVRQYRGVEVTNGRWSAVHALFLPHVTKPDSDLIAVDKLSHALPREVRYRFDRELVTNELDYYGVPVADQQYVLDALERIGVMPYVTMPDGRTRLFTIGVDDGIFAARVIQ